MRKTLLLTIDFPPQLGGVANYLANVCKNLPEKDIVVLANHTEGDMHYDGQQKYKIIRADLSYKFFWPKWLKAYSRAKRLIVKDKIEQLIISHILPIGYLALLLRLPYIVSLHGYDILAAQKTSWKKKWAMKILNQSKHIIVNSHNTQKLVLSLGIEQSKITIVSPCPNISPDNLNPTEQQMIFNDLDLQHKKILLTVGRLVPRKGIDMVIKALPEVIKTIPNLVYLVVGKGPDLKRLENLAEELKVRGNVVFIEDVNDKNLAAYYNLCNIFIMPARQIGEDVEGFGIVYLEANLFNKPVIAGKSGGVEDAVIDNQTGILVNPESVQEIVQAIIKLFSNPELANKFGVQGKTRVLNEFQWPIQINKLKNLL